VIHARVMVYAGHGYSPWAGSGRRQYSEPRDAKDMLKAILEDYMTVWKNLQATQELLADYDAKASGK
jgi:hypothetical protein